MALTILQQIRLEVGDTDVSLPILSDTEYEYFLEKHNNALYRASVDAARVILFKLSVNSSDQTVDIFSIKGSQAAKAYMEALKLYIRDPNLNQIGTNLQGWVGGISIAEMQANDANLDNNLFINPTNSPYNIPSSTDQYFGV